MTNETAMAHLVLGTRRYVQHLKEERFEWLLAAENGDDSDQEQARREIFWLGFQIESFERALAHAHGETA